MSIRRDPDAPTYLALCRRQFLLAGGAVALVGATGLRGAWADEAIVVADPGGPFGDGFRVAFHEPWAAAGHKSVQVPREHEPTAQFKAMVEANSYTWDVVTLTLSARDILVKQGLLEALDWSLPDMDQIMPEAKHENWMGTDVYCTILAYSTEKYGKEGPQSWRDFFDVEKFPGRRAMRSSPIDTLEEALLADGVAPKDLYPLDVDRAFAKLDQIKDHVQVWWTGGAQTTQMLQSGEVDMLPTWNARAQTVIDAGGSAAIAWDQGLYSVEGWAIPKGDPKADVGRQFIAFCANAERQAAFTDYVTYGPTNPKAYDYVKPEVAAKLPTAPDRLPKLILAQESWWSENRQMAEERFKAWLLT